MIMNSSWAYISQFAADSLIFTDLKNKLEKNFKQLFDYNKVVKTTYVIQQTNLQLNIKQTFL